MTERPMTERPMTERPFRTRGQPAAVGAVDAMLGTNVPHALLLVGPGGIGKTTLAMDLAAALLCRATGPSARPCGRCRACRSVDHGNHPDLHRLAPSGAGGVIPIGGRDERGVRDLVAELALLPVEGGARVAIIEAAHRMTEDAQSALLKTLEEPPGGTTLILCADDEERLLPTIRSRCVRLRLGSVGRRDIEAILREGGGVDATDAARAARLAGGRPGVALAYAAAPRAVILRGEIARSLLDLRGATRTARLTGVRDLAARAGELIRELEAGAHRSGDRLAAPAPVEPVASASAAEPEQAADARSRPRLPASERRAAAAALVAIWRDVLRDLVAVGLGDRRLVRDTDLFDDLEATAGETSPARVADGLRRLDLAGERLEGNVSPELVLDVLALQLVR
jgi:DNA polymerase III delta' subunit